MTGLFPSDLEEFGDTVIKGEIWGMVKISPSREDNFEQLPRRQFTPGNPSTETQSLDKKRTIEFFVTTTECSFSLFALLEVPTLLLHLLCASPSDTWAHTYLYCLNRIDRI